MTPSPSPYHRNRPAAPARRVALWVLRRALDPKAPGCDALLEESARREKLSPEDHALARELVYGVLRHRRWLETLLSRYIENPIAEFAPAVHEALLIGFYQLIHTERIPAHAAVDETVRLAAAQPGGAKLRSLVNAVMRRAAAEPREALLPHADLPWPVRHSVPDGLVSEAGRVLPPQEVEAFFVASNQPAPLCLRLVGEARRDPAAARERLETEIRRLDPDAAVRPGKLVPHCLIVEGRGIAPDRLPLFREGLLSVEDEGAQSVGLVASEGLTGPLRVLDLCASPGGKTAHLADLLPEAQITATDVSPAKIKRLAETVQRLKIQDRVSTALVTDLLASAAPQSFDLILVDAPCSGLGTLRRHPEIRYRRTAESMREMADVQFRLLGQAAVLLKPGGRLVFSVCTMSRQEGEEVRDRFLAEYPAFRPDGDSGIGSVAPGTWRLLTHLHGCDSFFIARFCRG